jgi:hypothetical protein
VLSNGMGGMSGKGVLPIALKCIRDIRAVSELPIIGCGGLLQRRRRGRGHGGRRRYVVGIGSALTGLNSEEIGRYFERLEQDLDGDSEHAEAMVRYDIDMRFTPGDPVSATSASARTSPC